MRQAIKVPYEYGKQVPLQMKKLKQMAGGKMLVPANSPALKKPAETVQLPMNQAAQLAVHDLM